MRLWHIRRAITRDGFIVGKNGKMLYENLSNLQTQENPLGFRQRLYDRQESLLLHWLWFFRLSLSAEAEPAKSAYASVPGLQIT